MALRFAHALTVRVPRRVFRISCGVGAVFAVMFGVFVLIMRYSVLPAVEQYRPDIEKWLSQSLRLPIHIEKLSADWGGFRPRLSIDGLQIMDPQGRPALRLDRVDAELGWLSLPTASLRLNRLDVIAPALSVRRDADGHVYIAGIRIDSGSKGGNVSDWVLSQSSINIRGALVEWTDNLRRAPTLQLRNVNFRLDNSGSRHRFGVQAEPPAHLATRVDLRGDMKGRDIVNLADWKGDLYVELDYADLAGWGAWVDYPVWLPRGSGSLRMWSRVADRKIEAVTADLALRDVSVRLSRELPTMELNHLAGRLQVRLPLNDDEALELSARRLALNTRDGINLPMMDFSTRWIPATDRTRGRGEFFATELDFLALAALSRHVPLDAALRGRLDRYAPRGRIVDIKLSWTSGDTGIDTFGLRAKFSGLGVNAHDLAPGFEGISGTVDANHRGGSMVLESRQSAVSLPAVFAEPRIAFDELNARLQWTVADGLIDAHLQNLTLANADASGQIFGHWRGRAGEKGEIDLNAQLNRARPDAVWRYLPLLVSSGTRDWVRHSIREGVCGDARLRLKGPVNKFPFEDPRSGLFQVTAKCTGVTLDYASGWVPATNVSASILFEGKRMLVREQSGKILGATLSNVTAEIPDLMHHDEILEIRGQAQGATSEFLEFIDQSPLSERLGSLADSIQAAGSGALDLKLVLPLRRPQQTHLAGQYQFKGNRIQFGEALPPFSDAAGQLNFTENSLSIRGATASWLGAPMTLTANTRPDGTFVANAQGRLAIADMRRTFDVGALEHLAGSSPWQASVTDKNGALSLNFESTLQGVASSLPAPFNKTAADAAPLKIEYTQTPAARGQMRLTLGRLVNMNLVRRSEPGQSGFERGVIAINDTATMPERGVLLAVNMKSFDYTAWRRALSFGDKSGGIGLPVTVVSAKAGVATLWGQLLNDVQINASLNDGAWQARVSSRETNGEVNYRPGGKGRVLARFKNLSIGELTADEASGPGSESAPAELPALDVVVDNFSLKGHPLGKLELLAINRGATWRMEKLAITHPDGIITGEGQWRTTPVVPKSNEPATQVNLKVETGNIGRLLGRVGYAEAVRRGSGRLEARLSWAGPPTRLDYPTLAGEVKVEAANGQFNKLEPGVGRLLGVVSLQALPRRITLDFRDVFSEGFAFDSISGSMKVSQGVMSTDELRIRGPAARISMKGEVDLAREIQNLRVRVQPTLSESVAIGAAIANPVAGVATYLAQKVLRDPFEKIFAFDYAVTGTWVDPRVQKLGSDDNSVDQPDGTTRK